MSDMDDKHFEQLVKETFTEFPKSEDHESHEEEKVSVKRGRIAEFTTYEVAEHELVLLEKGSDASLWLNFGVALLSVFFSLLAALLTLDSKNYKTSFIVLTIITVISGLLGLICMMFWWKNRGTQKTIFRQIRQRIREN